MTRKDRNRPKPEWEGIEIKEDPDVYVKIFDRERNSNVKTLIFVNDSPIWLRYAFKRYAEDDYDRIGPRGSRIYYSDSIPEELWVTRVGHDSTGSVKLGKFFDRVEFRPSGEMFISEFPTSDTFRELREEDLAEIDSIGEIFKVHTVETVNVAKAFGYYEENDEYLPLNVDNEGRINLGAESFEIDIGDVGILDENRDGPITPLFEHTELGQDPHGVEVTEDHALKTISTDLVYENLEHKTVVVEMGGTEEPLSETSVEVPNGSVLTIRALNDNTDVVYIGETGVTDVDGYPLNPAEAISTPIEDVSTVYVYGLSSGDGVSWMVTI